MIERMLHLVRRFVPLMLLGGMLGCLVGFGRASAHIAANGYLATGMESLAARVFAGVVWRSTGWGLALASLAFLSAGAIYALSRILRGGDSKSGYASWVATVTVLAAYVAVGIRLNKQHLPGFLSPRALQQTSG